MKESWRHFFSPLFTNPSWKRGGVFRCRQGRILSHKTNIIDISTLKKVILDNTLHPRDFAVQEFEHFHAIGLKTTFGAGLNIVGIHQGRLYFNNKEMIESVMDDLRIMGVITVVEWDLIRTVIYRTEQASILSFYLNGRNIDFLQILD